MEPDLSTARACAHALAEKTAEEANDFPSGGIYRGLKSGEVARTFALASIADSLARIADALEKGD